MSLKLGAGTHTLIFTHSLEGAIRRLAGLGFRYLKVQATPPHIWPPDFDEGQRRALRDLIDSLGMELWAVNASALDINLASPNSGFREETIVQVKEYIELTKDLGGKVFETTGGRVHNRYPPPYEDSWQVAKDSIARCVEHAEAHGIILGLENVPRRFLGTVTELKRMIQEVGSDNLRIVYDVANGHVMEKEESVPQVLKEIADNLVYIHISDNDGRTFSHLRFGEGNIDFHAVARTLREIGFEGVSIIETEHPQDPDKGFLDDIKALEQFGWEL